MEYSEISLTFCSLCGTDVEIVEDFVNWLDPESSTGMLHSGSMSVKCERCGYHARLEFTGAEYRPAIDELFYDDVNEYVVATGVRTIIAGGTCPRCR